MKNYYAAGSIEKEFNLSDKRKVLLKHTIDAFEADAITIEDVFIQIEKQDKEFIQRRDGFDRLYMLRKITRQEHADKCEKLAGESLVDNSLVDNSPLEESFEARKDTPEDHSSVKREPSGTNSPSNRERRAALDKALSLGPKNGTCICGHGRFSHFVQGCSTSDGINYKCKCKKFEVRKLVYCPNCLPDGNPSDQCKIEGHKYEK